MTCAFVVSAAAVVLIAVQAPAQGNFEIQNLMSSYNENMQTVDVGMMKLKRIVAQPAAPDSSKQRKEAIEELQKAVGAISDIAKKAQLAAQKEQAERRSIVNGNAAEFYAGTRALERAVAAFPMKGGVRDTEELQRVSDASEKVKKAVEDLRRAAPPAPKQRGGGA
jgi:hypothetical protein